MSARIHWSNCGRCGRPTPHEVDVSLRGEHQFAASACRSCVDETTDELALARPIFDVMIRQGVPRDVANDAMTALLARWTPDRAKLG